MKENNSIKLDTYINYNGNCKEAFQFYEKHLGGKITMMQTFNQSPEHTNVPPDWKNSIMHARIEFGNSVIMGADISNAEPMRSAYLTLRVNSDAEAERIYSLLTDGGQIFMKMEKAFFASRFGMLRDKFGTSWMILNENQNME